MTGAGFTVEQVRVGRVCPLGPKAVPSGIDKHSVSGPVMAGTHGMDGDEQGDLRHHGGPDKAIHAYAASNLPLWAADLPDQARLFVPGAFGENLVVGGSDESGVCLGDRWQIGAALCEVSQGRQPCWRLNLRFGRPDMAWLVQTTGRTGWYFRVLEPGLIAAGNRGVLLARPNPRWTITRVTRLLYHDRLDRAALAEFAALKGLPDSWRTLRNCRSNCLSRSSRASARVCAEASDSHGRSIASRGPCATYADIGIITIMPMSRLCRCSCVRD